MNKYNYFRVLFVLLFTLTLLGAVSASSNVPPKVISTDPPNHAINFQTHQNIVIKYNEPIKLEVNEKSLISSKGAHVKTLSYVKGNLLIITHDTLQCSTKYTLTLNEGCVTNRAGIRSAKYVTILTTAKKSPYILPSNVLANTKTMRGFPDRPLKNYLRYQVKNTGTIAAQNYIIRIYLTPKKSLKGTRYLVGKQLISYLTPGKTINLRTAVFTSYNIPLGLYYLAVVANTVSYSFIKTEVFPYNPFS